jgi:hypothetical protein
MNDSPDKEHPDMKPHVPKHVTKERSHTFEPANRCIYCGDTVGLTREHVIPIGLGGGYILPKASCGQCQKITRDFETICQRKHLLSYRLEHGLVRHLDEVSETTEVLVGSEKQSKHFDRKDVPSIMMLPDLRDRPGIISGRAPGAEFFSRWISIGSAEEIIRKREHLGKPASINIHLDLGAHIRMVAKIAHGFAIGYLGVDGFDHLLPDFILGKNNGLASYLVGAQLWEEAAPALPFLPNRCDHFITSRTVYDHSQNRLFYAVQVRLFAGNKGPVHTVIASDVRLTTEQLRKRGLA